MSVARIRRSRNFAAIPNDVLRHPGLSLQAKGLLTLMLSYPDDWAFRLTHLQGMSTNGRRAHQSALREIIAAGFARYEYVREGGRLAGRELVVTDEPIFAKTARPDRGPSEKPRNRKACATESVRDSERATTNTDSYEDIQDEDLEHTSARADARDGLGNVEDDGQAQAVTASPPSQASGGAPQANDDSRDAGNELANVPRDEKTMRTREAEDAVAAAYNEHRGPLPRVVVLSEKRRRKVRGFLREFPTVDEAVACMAMAAANVATDQFWQDRRYGFDNLLAEHRAIAKAEAVAETGTADAADVGVQRILAALEGMD